METFSPDPASLQERKSEKTRLCCRPCPSDTARAWREAGRWRLRPPAAPGPLARGVALFTPSPHLPPQIPAAAGEASPPNTHTHSGARRARLAAQQGRRSEVLLASPRGADAGVPGQRPSGASRTCLGAHAPAPPPQALLTWSWPKARSAAVTPRVQPGWVWVRQVRPCPGPAGPPTQGKAGWIALPSGE